MRTTCLYCANEGIRTDLVQVGHWGLCPLHSASYLESLSVEIPSELALVRKPTQEELSRGVPGWVNRIQAHEEAV